MHALLVAASYWGGTASVPGGAALSLPFRQESGDVRIGSVRLPKGKRRGLHATKSDGKREGHDDTKRA